MGKEYIWDRVRKRKVVATPEERVRQWIIGELTNNRGYPLEMLSCEYSFSHNRKAYRCDLLVFNRKLKPIMAIECKAPNVKIEQSVFDQIGRYNLALQVNYLLVTNGVESYLVTRSLSGEHSFISYIPHYNEISQQ
ncbi:MAG: type I restriction enzyme HsdR N-terminal domain-containing protein [Bacteroidales bacterium]